MRAQRLDQRRQPGHVADRVGQDAAVEIRAEADMVLAQPADQVVEVPQHRLPAHVRGRPCRRDAGRRWRSSAPPCPPRLADHVQLPVGQVARRGAERMGVGMGRHQRRVAERGHVVEALLVQVVRSIMIPQAVARAHQRACPRRSGPAPVSGSPGKLIGTPWPKTVGRLQTGPSDRSPSSWNRPARRGRGRSPRPPPCASPRRSCPPPSPPGSPRRVRQTREIVGRRPLHPVQQPRHRHRHRLGAAVAHQRRQRDVVGRLAPSASRNPAAARPRRGRHEDREKPAREAARPHPRQVRCARPRRGRATAPRAARGASAAAAGNRCDRRRRQRARASGTSSA